jgi:hypothetical protein
MTMRGCTSSVTGELVVVAKYLRQAGGGKRRKARVEEKVDQAPSISAVISFGLLSTSTYESICYTAPVS